MTTKPKAAIPAVSKDAAPNDYDPGENEICKLIARWKFLDATAKYQALVASDKEAPGRHEKELAEIKNKLAGLVPKTFNEVIALFDFAFAAILEKIDRPESAKAEIKMLKAIKSGFLYASHEAWAENTIKRIREAAELKMRNALAIKDWLA